MQVSTAPQAPAAPTAPAAPALAPTPLTVTTVGPDGKTQTLPIPRTAAEIEQLRSQRSELSDQLTSATSRRRSLSEEIRSAPDGASRQGLEDRVRVLDKRIIQLETDIAATGRQLSAAPAELIASSEGENQPQGGGGDWEEGMAAGAFSMLFFLGLVAAWRRWRRPRKAKSPQANLLTESAQRLERLEQGVEAIAIEVERISEGQRFVTKLFSESEAAIGAPNRLAQSATERGTRR